MKEQDFKHITVLLEETVNGLDIKPDGIYVDGTLGGGGHSRLILEQLTTGKLIGIDQDLDALGVTTERLKEYGDKFIPYHSNYVELLAVLKDLNIDKIDGILLDLGVSSYQIDEASRGFSYMNDGALDMRMDRTQSFSAMNVVNDYSEKELQKIIKMYGEENWAARIAKFIVEKRKEQPIETTHQLVSVIEAAIPKKARKPGSHPAKRTFQAIRIEVNNELKIIEKLINDATQVLNPQGRLSIITFHSLEDRIVKSTFKTLSNPCTCPHDFPICVCGKEASLKLITRKPILPNEEEMEMNPRSRSAKLRVAERI